MAIAASYISATTFAVASDLTGKFMPGLRVCADCGDDGLRLGSVVGSIYDAESNRTGVTLVLDAGVLTAGLTSVAHGYDTPASVPRATTDLHGAVRLATDAEAVDGIDTAKAVTPTGLSASVGAAMFRFAEEISIARFGATGAGTGDDTQAFTDWLHYIHTFGYRGWIPAGTYHLSSTVQLSPAAPLTIAASTQATLVCDHNGAILDITGNDYAVHIDGGIWDGSSQSLPGPGESWALFMFTHCNSLKIENALFKAGSTYLDAKSDSHIFIVGNDCVIRDCKFIGGSDASVYLSGSYDQNNSNHHVVTGCAFYGCLCGVIVKRQGQRTIVTHNYFERCQYGVATGEADAVKLPGKRCVVSNNTFYKTTLPIDLRCSDYSVVVGNQILDYGHDMYGAAVPGSSGISISGSSHCVVSGNVVSLVDYAAPVSGLYAIVLSPWTFNGTTYNATHNSITCNAIDSCATGIYEAAGGVYNQYSGNKITNFNEYDYFLNSTTSQAVAFNDSEITFIQSNAVRARLSQFNWLVGCNDSSINSPGVKCIASGLMRVVTDANVGMQVNRQNSDGQVVQFMRSGTVVGSVSCYASSTVYATSSDARLKNIIKEIDDGVERINAIRPVYFRWLQDGDDGDIIDGFVAQELQLQLPHAVSGKETDTDEDGHIVYMGVDQSKLTPLLVAALKELAARVAALESKYA